MKINKRDIKYFFIGFGSAVLVIFLAILIYALKSFKGFG
jgi:hypothetical protein